MGYAFISYSTKNQTSADAMKNLLNNKGIETWMAPGDIPAGSKYAGVINKALRECSCLVLMLTEAAQRSTWVTKELDKACSYGKTIIPVQLENVVLNDAFDFYISTDQVVAVKKIDESTPEIKKILASIIVCTGSVPADNDSLQKKTTVSKSTKPAVDNNKRMSYPHIRIFERLLNARNNNNTHPKNTKKTNEPLYQGQRITFGNYHGCRDWLVLEVHEDKALVVSNEIVDARPFNDERLNDTNWTSCSLMKWLNAEFISTAFSAEEQSKIVPTQIQVDDIIKKRAADHYDTCDDYVNTKVFILSLDEIEKYFPSNDSRKCKPSLYATDKNITVAHGTDSGFWWARTPGEDADRATVISSFGDISYKGDNVMRSCNGVRPAMWIECS